MEPSTPSPEKRRPRWLIVAFVLVLVSLGTWWFWPRGDARFVGKWAVAGQSHIFTFRSNGTSLSARDGQDGLTSTWRVDGETLILRSELSSWLRRALTIVHEPLTLITGYRLNYGAEELFRIVDVSESTIQLRQFGDDGVVTLTRIPE